MPALLVEIPVSSGMMVFLCSRGFADDGFRDVENSGRLSVNCAKANRTPKKVRRPTGGPVPNTNRQARINRINRLTDSDVIPPDRGTQKFSKGETKARVKELVAIIKNALRSGGDKIRIRPNAVNSIDEVIFKQYNRLVQIYNDQTGPNDPEAHLIDFKWIAKAINETNYQKTIIANPNSLDRGMVIHEFGEITVPGFFPLDNPTSNSYQLYIKFVEDPNNPLVRGDTLDVMSLHTRKAADIRDAYRELIKQELTQAEKEGRWLNHPRNRRRYSTFSGLTESQQNSIAKVSVKDLKRMGAYKDTYVFLPTQTTSD